MASDTSACSGYLFKRKDRFFTVFSPKSSPLHYAKSGRNSLLVEAGKSLPKCVKGCLGTAGKMQFP